MKVAPKPSNFHFCTVQKRHPDLIAKQTWLKIERIKNPLAKSQRFESLPLQTKIPLWPLNSINHKSNRT